MELNFPIAYSGDKQMDLIPYCHNSTSYTQTLSKCIDDDDGVTQKRT